MKIAYLCHRIPYPPNKGDKIRAFQQLQAMATRHEVDLFTLIDDSKDIDNRIPLTRYCREVTAVRIDPRLAKLRALPYLLSRTPLTSPYFYSAELNAAVRGALVERSYDRIFVYCSAMAQYVESVSGIPVITDFVDVDSDKWTQYADHARFPMSVIYRREGHCLRSYERKVCGQSVSVVVTTDREAELVREIAPSANVHVITNGVDTEYFSPDAVGPAPTVPTILFTGDMSYFPNEEAVVSFARDVLPLVRESIPVARFLIVGRNPGPNVTKMHDINGVEVTGFVSDVRTYLAQAHVSVAPFSVAAGIQNKILEAMSYGLPVVATPRAAQGLSREVAQGIDTAACPEDMAAVIGTLLQNPEIARRKGIQGRALVSQVYDWGRSNSQLLNLLDNPTQREPLCGAVVPLAAKLL